ncbi:EscU/YscU/HrcU family type III secretion system export apparatus switch protein [Pseudomonas hunanensis]|uniref:EscU/YscU/HrcU family type III secretion system export apparatus switch protein n=1 Tax=Pseudomonas hunanensis TaxID=1247546 RepID=UPI0024052C09|nr:EscU/YscU/HrcU family type III secretion system export apparatus switch protein [Pseudomonas hunanensis]
MSTEKTEHPTRAKLRDARHNGQVVKSKELVSSMSDPEPGRAAPGLSQLLPRPPASADAATRSPAPPTF